MLGVAKAVALLSQLGREGLAISLVTYGEVYEGIYYGRDTVRSRQLFAGFLRGMQVIPLNRSVMRRFAIVRGDLRRQGQLIGDTDLLIAATALHHDLTLITRNTKHFERIPGLKLYASA
jgi:predicted nucleic acid-binding protein